MPGFGINTFDITSRANPRLKSLLEHIHRFYVFEGEKLVNDLLRRAIPIKILAAAHHYDLPPFIPKSPPQEFWRVSDTVMEKLSSLKEKTTALAIVEQDPPTIEFSGDPATFSPVIIALDNIQDPANAGTVVRCAAAFGTSAVAFTGGSVKPTHPKFLRAAQNAIFDIRFRSFPNLNDLLTLAQAAQYHIYLTSSHSGPHSITPEHAATPCLAVFGNEGQGLDPNWFNRFPAIRIPQTQNVESLNVGVSACIIMHELFKKH